jgi:phage-related tail fiber protein
MSNFSQLVLTMDGINLQAKAQSGTLLKFTRVGVGDGALREGQHLNTLTNLINYRTSFPINDIKNKGDGTSVVRTIITNKDIEEGFFLREIGLYAEDPDKGEILYCVANTGMYADFLPPKTLNSVDIILDLITIVGNAENVVIKMDDSLVYVTREEFNNLAGDGRTDETVKKNADDILMLGVEVAILKNAALNNFTSNIFVVNFDDIEEDEVVEGVWDKSSKRLMI